MMALSYSWLGKNLALDFANTVIDEDDGLATDEGLARWLGLERDRLGAAPGVEARLPDFRRLREAVRALFIAAAEAVELPRTAVAVVNGASAAAPSFVQLRGAWVAAAESCATSPADAILGEIAASAIELVGGADRELVRVCHAPNCGLFFLAARERQQWCSPTCGNRARVARHYARGRAG